MYVFDLKRQVAGTRMTPIGVVDKGRKREEETAKNGEKEEDAATPATTPVRAPARTRSERKSRSATERQSKNKAEFSSMRAGSESRAEASPRVAPAQMTSIQEFNTFVTPLFNNWNSLNQKIKVQEQELTDLNNVNQYQAGKLQTLGAKVTENDTPAETGLRAALDLLTTELGKTRSEIAKLKDRNVAQEKMIADLNDEIRVLKVNPAPGPNGVQSYPATSSSKPKAPRPSRSRAARASANKLARPAIPPAGSAEEEDISGVFDQETRRSKTPILATPAVRPGSAGIGIPSIDESAVIGEAALNSSSALKSDMVREPVSFLNGNAKASEEKQGGGDSKKRPASRDSRADTSSKSRKLGTSQDHGETTASPVREFSSPTPERLIP